MFIANLPFADKLSKLRDACNTRQSQNIVPRISGQQSVPAITIAARRKVQPLAINLNECDANRDLQFVHVDLPEGTNYFSRNVLIHRQRRRLRATGRLPPLARADAEAIRVFESTGKREIAEAFFINEAQRLGRIETIEPPRVKDNKNDATLANIPTSNEVDQTQPRENSGRRKRGVSIHTNIPSDFSKAKRRRVDSGHANGFQLYDSISKIGQSLAFPPWQYTSQTRPYFSQNSFPGRLVEYQPRRDTVRQNLTFEPTCGQHSSHDRFQDVNERSKPPSFSLPHMYRLNPMVGDGASISRQFSMRL